MKNYLDFLGQKPVKTIEDLRQTVDKYMKYKVDGDKFEKEEDFEREVRDMLEREGFIVQPKKNVKNSMLFEKLYSGDIDNQIPDIVVECKEGKVFLELKLRKDDNWYKSDITKVHDYLTYNKCVASGVLFLHKGFHANWIQCLNNLEYWYFWRIY